MKTKEQKKGIQKINDEQWRIMQQLGAWAESLRSLKTTGQTRKDKPQCAPEQVLPMVF